MSPSPVARPGWRFPPPAVGRHWFWIALTASLLGFTVLVGSVVALIAAGVPESDALIEDPVVLSAIEDACEDLTFAVDNTDMGTTERDRAGAVADQNLAIEVLVAEVQRNAGSDALRRDDPARAWLGDWRDLRAAREDYLDALVGGASLESVDVEVPDDPFGDPITERMNDALVAPVCEVPEILSDPDLFQKSTT